MSIIFLGRKELKLVQERVHGDAREISTSNFAYRSFKFWGARFPGSHYSGPMITRAYATFDCQYQRQRFIPRCLYTNGTGW